MWTSGPVRVLSTLRTGFSSRKSLYFAAFIFNRNQLTSPQHDAAATTMHDCWDFALIAAGMVVSLELPPNSTQNLKVIFGFLVTSLTKAFLPRLLSLARWPAPGRSSGHPKLLPFKDFGGHCALRILNCSRNSFMALPRFVSQFCLWAVTVLLTSWFTFTLISTVSWTVLYRQACAFINKSNQFESVGLVYTFLNYV